MNQIKFLAWSKEENKFILDYKRICPACYVYKEPKYCFIDVTAIEGIESYCELFLSSTLKDIKGQDIFDGNILRELDDGSEWFYEVRNVGSKFVCIYHMLDFKSWTYDVQGHEVFDEIEEEFPLEDVYFKCEVVGHIKTHPELVKP